jgi:hypothetical protein
MLQNLCAWVIFSWVWIFCRFIACILEIFCKCIVCGLGFLPMIRILVFNLKHQIICWFLNPFFLVIKIKGNDCWHLD